MIDFARIRSRHGPSRNVSQQVEPAIGKYKKHSYAEFRIRRDEPATAVGGPDCSFEIA